MTSSRADSATTARTARWTAPVSVVGRGWFVRHRYALLAGLVTVLVASQTRNRQWTKDIWLHAGVTAELARAPFDPADPVFGGAGTPNEWLSPYGLATGTVGGLLGLAPLTTLSVFAVVNTVALLAALWWFVVTVTANRRAPLYALLAGLLVWGPGAWRWSGFAHLDALGYVASYPATAATAALLATLALTARLLDGAPGFERGPRRPGRSRGRPDQVRDHTDPDVVRPDRVPRHPDDGAGHHDEDAAGLDLEEDAGRPGETPGLAVRTPHRPGRAAGSASRGIAAGVGIALGAWFVVLSHPPSAPVLAVGLVAVVASRASRRLTTGHIVLGAALAGAALGVGLWPYFSVLELDASGEIVAPMAILYDEPLRRIAPALLGLPIVVLRSRERPRDLLGLLLVGTLAVYLFGWATGHDELGRSIAAAVLVLHIALGDGLGRIEARWSAGHRSVRPAEWALVGASAVAALAGAWWLKAGLVRTAPEELWPDSVAADARLEARDEGFEVVTQVVPDGATVLAAVPSAQVLPAQGAKVVAWPYWAGAGVTDAPQRRADAQTFFAPGASATTRQAVLDRYRPFAVVVDRDVVAPSVESELAALGLVEVARTDRVSVWRLPPT